MKIVSIVGARPEFVQAQPVSLAVRARHTEILVHTGQHYDYQMSQAFFDELGIPVPEYNLGVGSGSHGRQTAEILTRLEKTLLTEQPDLVVVRGDTNSTLAGALAASKLQIPTAHIEAGERSYDRRMPEEINRLAADSLADLHFCASRSALRQLAYEGITRTAHWVGDVMFDARQANLGAARRTSRVLEQLDLRPEHYALVTVHRAATTDNPARLRQVVELLNRVPEPIVFPVHPRTRKSLMEQGLTLAGHIQAIAPVGYFDMMVLEENARLIATDSGGVQREAYFASVPCLTLRDETEWVETVEAGWNKLVGVDWEIALEAWRSFSPPSAHPPLFGEGDAAQRIAEILDHEPVQFGQGSRASAEARRSFAPTGAAL